MASLFLVTIGPVQDFIASARRCRDLWFGSWLLSELSKAAAKAIADVDEKDSLIFPSPASDLSPGSPVNVANFIFAHLHSATPKDTSIAIKDAVMTRLRKIREEAYAAIPGRSSLDEAVAEAQIDDLPELYWASLPIADDMKDYVRVRRDLYTLLAARKATRDFKQPGWQPSSSPKSSLDGLRESVIPESVYDRKTGWSDAKLRRVYGVRRGERLCGVGLLKRHGERQGGRVFSTSHVAVLPLLERMARIDARTAATAFATYADALHQLGVADADLGNVPGASDPVIGQRDGHVLFEERLSEFVDEDNLADAKKALATFLHTAAPKGDKGWRPLPYYALLVADGDYMGRVIDDQDTIDKHRRLSLAVSTFAEHVRDVVAAHRGSVVYCGGDDIVAFLPLHTAIACATKLAGDFVTALSRYTWKDDNGKERPLTLSAGLAVCHHLDPLADALDLARNAEKTAKKTRNALAVIVSKRSGADVEVAGEWGELDVRLQTFIRLHRDDAIPDNAAYQLRELALRLRVKSGEPDAAVLSEALVAEARDTLMRKREKRGTAPIGAGTLARLPSVTEAGHVRRLADELIVARVFADAGNLANPAATDRREADAPSTP